MTIISVKSNDASESTYEQIRKIQQEIGTQRLFEDISNPSEWQRQIRSEWERDFTNINTSIPPSGGQGV